VRWDRVAVDARIIAAANRPLEQLVKKGTFRADLYHRLNVIRLSLLPLRERAEDIPALLLKFARRYANLHRRIESLEPTLVHHLEAYPFDGCSCHVSSPGSSLARHRADAR
jgi:DNA-binding NtrC family response regulator